MSAEEELEFKKWNTGIEKREICKVYFTPDDMMKGDASPPHRSAYWIRANSSGPMRELESHLCGFGQTAVRGVLQRLPAAAECYCLPHQAVEGGQTRWDKNERLRPGGRIALRSSAKTYRSYPQVRKGEYAHQHAKIYYRWPLWAGFSGFLPSRSPEEVGADGIKPQKKEEINRRRAPHAIRKPLGNFLLYTPHAGNYRRASAAPENMDGRNLYQ